MSLWSRLFGPATGRIAPAAFVSDRDPEAPLLDVRTLAEFAGGHLAGAVNVDVMAPGFERRLAALGLPVDGAVYVYCRSGHRASRAVVALHRLGHAGAVNAGGLGALVAAGAR